MKINFDIFLYKSQANCIVGQVSIADHRWNQWVKPDLHTKCYHHAPVHRHSDTTVNMREANLKLNQSEFLKLFLVIYIDLSA